MPSRQRRGPPGEFLQAPLANRLKEAFKCPQNAGFVDLGLLENF